MKILNELGNEITDPDLTLGELVKEEMVIAHHPAVEAVEEQWHYETLKNYPNGGKDVVKVVDVPGVAAREAWTETEEVLRYKLFTRAQLAGKASEAAQRPMTALEVLSMLLPSLVNTLTVDNNTALRMKSFYPAFEDLIGQKVRRGFKFRYAGDLWETVQPETPIQQNYPPSQGTESFYSRIAWTYAGTMEDPIPYEDNMTLAEGMYYLQEGSLFRCKKGFVYPARNALRDLIGQQLEEVAE